jgi:hypothetical protein
VIVRIAWPSGFVCTCRAQEKEEKKMKKLKELNKNKVKEKNGIEKYGKKRWDVNDTPYL